jgi:hypothetical protein
VRDDVGAGSSSTASFFAFLGLEDFFVQILRVASSFAAPGLFTFLSLLFAEDDFVVDAALVFKRVP